MKLETAVDRSRRNGQVAGAKALGHLIYALKKSENKKRRTSDSFPLAKKTLCVVIAAIFLLNDSVFALAPGMVSGTLRPDGKPDSVKDSMYAAGQKRFAQNVGPGAIDWSRYFSPTEFLGSTPSPGVIKFLDATQMKRLPKDWDKNYLLKNNISDLEEAMKYFLYHDAHMRGIYDVSVKYFEIDASKGELPISRWEYNKATERWTLVLHRDFVRMWNDLKKNDVWFEYAFGDGQVRTVSLAWATFYRIAKHEMSDLKDINMMPKSYGHMSNTSFFAGPNTNELIANSIGGRYNIVNDAVWMWFLGSYAFAPTTQYNNDALKNRLLWFFGLYEGEGAEALNRQAIKMGLPDEFPNLHNAKDRQEAIAITLAINHRFFARRLDRVKKRLNPGNFKDANRVAFLSLVARIIYKNGDDILNNFEILSSLTKRAQDRLKQYLYRAIVFAIIQGRLPGGPDDLDRLAECSDGVKIDDDLRDVLGYAATDAGGIPDQEDRQLRDLALGMLAYAARDNGSGILEAIATMRKSSVKLKKDSIRPYHYSIVNAVLGADMVDPSSTAEILNYAVKHMTKELDALSEFYLKRRFEIDDKSTMPATGGGKGANGSHHAVDEFVIDVDIALKLIARHLRLHEIITAQKLYELYQKHYHEITGAVAMPDADKGAAAVEKALAGLMGAGMVERVNGGDAIGLRQFSLSKEGRKCSVALRSVELPKPVEPKMEHRAQHTRPQVRAYEEEFIIKIRTVFTIKTLERLIKLYDDPSLLGRLARAAQKKGPAAKDVAQKYEACMQALSLIRDYLNGMGLNVQDKDWLPLLGDVGGPVVLEKAIEGAILKKRAIELVEEISAQRPAAAGLTPKEMLSGVIVASTKLFASPFSVGDCVGQARKMKAANGGLVSGQGIVSEDGVTSVLRYLLGKGIVARSDVGEDRYVLTRLGREMLLYLVPGASENSALVEALFGPHKLLPYGYPKASVVEALLRLIRHCPDQACEAKARAALITLGYQPQAQSSRLQFLRAPSSPAPTAVGTNSGRFPRRPGKSPDDAMIIIACHLLKHVTEGNLTTDRYLDKGYAPHYSKYGFEPPAEKRNSSLSTVRRDLQGLVDEGVLEIAADKKSETGGAVYAATFEGAKRLKRLSLIRKYMDERMPWLVVEDLLTLSEKGREKEIDLVVKVIRNHEHSKDVWQEIQSQLAEVFTPDATRLLRLNSLLSRISPSAVEVEFSGHKYSSDALINGINTVWQAVIPEGFPRARSLTIFPAGNGAQSSASIDEVLVVARAMAAAVGDVMVTVSGRKDSSGGYSPDAVVRMNLSGRSRIMALVSSTVADRKTEQIRMWLARISQTVAREYKQANTPARALSARRTDAPDLPQILAVFAAPVAGMRGPAVVEPTSEDIANFYPVIEELDVNPVEIYISQSLNKEFTRSMHKTIEELNKRRREQRLRKGVQLAETDVISVKPYSAGNLARKLELTQKSDGVRRIFINDDSVAQEFRSLISTDEGAKCLKGNRVISASIPSGKTDTEKSIHQAWLIKVAILSCLITKDNMNGAVGIALRTEIDGRIMDARGELADSADSFVRKLIAGDDETGAAQVRERMEYFLNRTVKLSRFIGEQIRILRAFWTAA